VGRSGERFFGSLEQEVERLALLGGNSQADTDRTGDCFLTCSVHPLGHDMTVSVAIPQPAEQDGDHTEIASGEDRIGLSQGGPGRIGHDRRVIIGAAGHQQHGGHAVALSEVDVAAVWSHGHPSAVPVAC
jgi:hypothetical protein